MPKITRAVKGEILFPNARKADLFGDDGLYKKLWTVQNDLVRASNQLISAMYQLKIGTVEWPLHATKVDANGAPQKRSLKTLAYQGLSGSWQPFGRPMYVARGERASSAVLVETANLVHDRLNTDFMDILLGKKSLSTFRSIPLGFAAKSMNLLDDGRMSLPVFAGRKGRVKIGWRKLGTQKAIYQRIRSGHYKLGSCKLSWHKPPGRKGRWMLSMSWTGEIEAASDGPVRIAAVHLGIMSTASIAYLDANGAPTRYKDIVDFPDSAVRAWRRLEKERRTRQNYNRNEVGARQGRGRNRKLRVSRAIGNKVQRLVETTVEQLAAQVVATVKRRGASVLVIENLTNWSRDLAMDELMENEQESMTEDELKPLRIN